MERGERQAIAGDLWDRVIAVTESLEPDDWSRPTPCPAWDVHDVLTHLTGLQTAFEGLPQPSPPEGWSPPEGLGPVDMWTSVGVAARQDWGSEQVVEELRQARAAHVERLGRVDPEAPTQGPTGPTTEHGLFMVRCFDIWVHVQDLAVGLGRPMDVEDSSAEARVAAEFVFQTVPYLYGKKAGAPEGEVMRFTLSAPLEHDGVLTVTEGRARWDEDTDPEAAAERNAFRATSGAFTLLAAGRGSPEEYRDRGALSWSGPNADTFVQRARLF